MIRRDVVGTACALRTLLWQCKGVGVVLALCCGGCSWSWERNECVNQPDCQNENERWRSHHRCEFKDLHWKWAPDAAIDVQENWSYDICRVFNIF